MALVELGMELEEAIEFCLGLGPVEETTPFGPEALVYKVGGKMFALAGAKNVVGSMNLKGEPERNVELRDEWEAVTPGYHMNKKHWNTIVFDGSLPTSLVKGMIEESYRLVVAGLPKKVREGLEN
ncbi:MAG: MmcQ/YjbR family DNA-binding protein [Verrucomicrobiota bacterium]